MSELDDRFSDLALKILNDYDFYKIVNVNNEIIVYAYDIYEGKYVPFRDNNVTLDDAIKFVKLSSPILGDFKNWGKILHATMPGVIWYRIFDMAEKNKEVVFKNFAQEIRPINAAFLNIFCAVIYSTKHKELSLNVKMQESQDAIQKGYKFFDANELDLLCFKLNRRREKAICEARAFERKKRKQAEQKKVSEQIPVGNIEIKPREQNQPNQQKTNTPNKPQIVEPVNEMPAFIRNFINLKTSGATPKVEDTTITSNSNSNEEQLSDVRKDDPIFMKRIYGQGPKKK